MLEKIVLYSEPEVFGEVEALCVASVVKATKVKGARVRAVDVGGWAVYYEVHTDPILGHIEEG